MPASHPDPSTSPRASQPARPLLSVAICTHNRSLATARCLAGLGAPRSDIDILIIDSGSNAIEAEAIERISTRFGAQHIRLAAMGLSAARNAALAASHGTWIAYLDDDATPAPDWVEVLTRSIAQDPDIAAMGGSILPQFQSRLPSWWPPSLRAVLTIIDTVKPDDPGAADTEPYAANIAFRRDILTRFGGFPACLGRHGVRLLSNEETYIIRRLRRARLKVRFNPHLVVHHEIARERLQPAWLIDRQYWSGVSEAVMLGALAEPRARKAWRMAAHTILLAPLLFWPKSSTALLTLRCTAAFAAGFVHGILTDAPDRVHSA
ncbi:MAG: glycosyltransferase [Acidiphilium sp.]|jgi:glycosyltransferase involved in cell wall biosynthesis|nr:glycosyltransferase [Acidiphilium sp.]